MVIHAFFSLSGFSIGAVAICVPALSSYFDVYYDSAVAFANAGVGVGVMILPLLTLYLLEAYGWRGAQMIVGGLNLHIIVCGATLRHSGIPNTPPAPTPNERRCKSKQNRNIVHDLGFDLFTDMDSGFHRRRRWVHYHWVDSLPGPSCRRCRVQII